MLDPSQFIVAFLDLPYWAKLTLLIMAAVIGLMSSVLGTALRSRLRALSRLGKLTDELDEEKRKLASEKHWRLADERVSASLSAERTSRGTAEPSSPVPLDTP
ncbi:hypothetical protein OCOJLMKI_4125 [Methylobacterium iners]|uniref:Lipopolysaccharide assembly protein A domain-containing protein n=1 Tax=Methylobacterium iners TaxID=418707 RepID=A0ABQ4S371_9HYPH|nr:hypothetical protein OCOJLMKI_4125 [Methylobacterium iners]